MLPTIKDFEAKGWFLSQEGIDLIANENESEITTLDDFIAIAKDTDLRLLTKDGFNKTAEKSLKQIPSPVVLQILEVKNVAMPSIHQIDDQSRLLSITFTDGSKKKFKGVEIFGRVNSVK
ncbi:MAG: hypothetical protein EXX96DRAFT_318080 [Benjaminiella poitrasii]|nr:MAG: hypothetical protein EXX96DRAFT_318080 [Benjaminiella poitrasii]